MLGKMYDIQEALDTSGEWARKWNIFTSESLRSWLVFVALKVLHELQWLVDHLRFSRIRIPPVLLFSLNQLDF